MEVALDLAAVFSDHPWVVEHPEWFCHRVDGTIQYAENPPSIKTSIHSISKQTHGRNSGVRFVTLWRFGLPAVSNFSC